MVSKMGRPLSSNPKSNQYRIRMTNDEVEMLEFCCEKTGKSKADIIRDGIKKVYQELLKE